MPQLGDPNFHGSVVLMLEHAQGGSMGIVINRSASLSLRELGQTQNLGVASLRGKESVFVGGPVEPQRGFVLHDRPDIEEKQEVLPGLYLSVTLDALGPLLAEDRGRMRFCLGYAGWGPQQLEQEMAQGSWLFAEAEAEAVLGLEPPKLWEETVRKLGIEPGMLVPGKGIH